MFICTIFSIPIIYLIAVLLCNERIIWQKYLVRQIEYTCSVHNLSLIAQPHLLCFRKTFRNGQLLKHPRQIINSTSINNSNSHEDAVLIFIAFTFEFIQLFAHSVGGKHRKFLGKGVTV